MKPLILFGDRISHPSRACLMLMKSNPGLTFEEKSVSLFKGEQHKLKELPLKQIPVLHHGDKVIAQSTTILRYTASNFCEKFWYENPKTRFIVDEYFDFWQATKNPPLLSAVRNACFYKALFGLNEPDKEAIKKLFKEFQASLKVFDKHFLQGGPFIGGSTAITIGDLLAANTLEQAKLVDEKLINARYGDYLSRCEEKITDYRTIMEGRDILKKLTKT